MIRFALKCACGHRFESWFRDNQAYEDLSGAGRIACPSCGGADVVKAPMAPNLATARAASPDESAERLRGMLLALRDAVETNCEDVGSAFAEEARKIHYGEAPARGIYGEASAEEANALVEEEVGFTRLPWISRGDS